jgi:hypothetical protein
MWLVYDTWNIAKGLKEISRRLEKGEGRSKAWKIT